MRRQLLECKDVSFQKIIVLPSKNLPSQFLLLIVFILVIFHQALTIPPAFSTNKRTDFSKLICVYFAKLYIYIHKQYEVQLLQINSYTVFNFHPMFSNLEMLLYEAAVPHLALVSATRQCLVDTNNFRLDNGAGSNHNI